MIRLSEAFLCEGMLLDFIIHVSVAKNGRRNRNTHLHLTESKVLEELYRVVEPGYTPSVPLSSSSVSKYKTCKSMNCAGAPDDEHLKNSFKKQMEDEPKLLLKRMNMFIQKCLMWNFGENMTWLGCALLELIKNDKKILPSDEIYLNGDYSFVKKEDLFSDSHKVVYLSNLLLGAYYFIVLNRMGQNRKSTYDEWHTTGSMNGRPTALEGDVGKSFKDKVTIEISTLALEEDSHTQNIDSQPHVTTQTVENQTVSHQTVNLQQVTNQYSIVGGTFQFQNGNNNRSFPGNITNLTINNE